jgi:hypothetical protein
LSRHSPPQLAVIAERRLADLVGAPGKDAVLEASGVVARGRDFFVIFDNFRRIARIDRGLDPASSRHGWHGPLRRGEGYEDIAYSAARQRFYLLVEAQKHPDGTYRAEIEECDRAGRSLTRLWVDVPFAKRNRGFEGLSVVRWNGRDYLLALCEGNRCRSGRKGRKPGGGRIHVLEKRAGGWRSAARIKLPRRAAFEDYSAIDLRGNRVAVVSQQTSQLWLGVLRPRDWTIAGPGRVYDMPRTGKGKRLYCAVEGIAWLSPTRFVAVSDAAKPGEPKRCRKKSQSIHIFELPAAGRKAGTRSAPRRR